MQQALDFVPTYTITDMQPGDQQCYNSFLDGANQPELPLEDVFNTDLFLQQDGTPVSINDALRIDDPFLASQGYTPIDLPSPAELEGDVDIPDQFHMNFNPGFDMNVPDEAVGTHHLTPAYVQTPSSAAYSTPGSSSSSYDDSDDGQSQSSTPMSNQGLNLPDEAATPHLTPAYIQTPASSGYLTPQPSHHLPLLQYDSTTSSPASSILATPHHFSNLYASLPHVYGTFQNPPPPPPPPQVYGTFQNERNEGQNYGMIEDWRMNAAVQQPASSLPYPLQQLALPLPTQGAFTQRAVYQPQAITRGQVVDDGMASMDLQLQLQPQSMAGDYEPEDEFATPSSIGSDLPETDAEPDLALSIEERMARELFGPPQPQVPLNAKKSKTHCSNITSSRRLHPETRLASEPDMEQHRAIKRLTDSLQPPLLFTCKWQGCNHAILGTNQNMIRSHLKQVHNIDQDIGMCLTHTKDVHSPEDSVECPGCGRAFERYRDFVASHVPTCIEVMDKIDREVSREASRRYRETSPSTSYGKNLREGW